MFGGFGAANNNNAGAFGQQPQGPQQQQGGLFGAAPAAGTGGFGGFGAQPQQNAFGQPQQQPQQGGFGSFGLNTNTGATSQFGSAARPAFGQAQSATTAAPSMFGQPQQQQTSFGFGAQQNQQTGGLFGAAASSTPQNAFGAAPTSSFGFGAPAAGAANATTPSFGAPGQTTPTNNFGTGNPAYAVTQERESSTGLNAGAVSNFLAITAMPNYKNWSFEELRVQDYMMGKKFSSTAPGMGGASGAFGAPANTGFGAASNTGFGGSTLGGGGGLFGSSQPAQSSTGFGFGAAAAPSSTGLFGAPAAAAPSMFGAAAPTGFGAPAAASTGFGAASTGGFGQPATGGAFSFGGAANTAPKTGFGFGSAATTPSAFGAAPTTSGFGQATTNAFGQQQQTTGAFGAAAPTSGGLFGAKSNTTSPFGGGATTGFGATTGAFGTPAPAAGAFGQQAATTGGLFGQNQSAAQTNPFGMGGGTTTPAAGGGLFGSTAPASGGGFGSSLGGGFGATPGKPATGGLFGQTTSNTGAFGGFGQTAAPATGGGLFGGGSSFGATATPAPAATGGLFGGGFGQATLGGGAGAFSLGGNQQQQQPQQSSMFGGSALGGGGLFGGQSTNSSMPFNSQQQQQQQQQPTMQASINKNPYGNNPLFSSSAAKPNTNASASQSSGAAPALFPATEEKKQAVLPHYKMTPKSASKIKLRGFTPSRIPGDFFGGIGSGSVDSKGAAATGGLPQSVLGMLKDESGDALGGGAMFKPRIKKLVITEESESNAETNGSVAAAQNGTPGGANRSVRFLDESPAFNVPVVDVTAGVSGSATPRGGKSPAASKTLASPGVKTGTPSKSKQSISRYSSPGATVYETEPSYEELLQMSDAELTQVEGYTVSLPNIGRVKFLQPVNLLQASPTGTRAGIQDIPGNVVILKHKVIEVYPDEGGVKHPVGMGVNVPAEVYLERCWPVDKRSGEIITDETDPRFDRHFKKLEGIEGTKLLGYNKTSGTWRFKVDHFSKYALDDDEDDEEEATAQTVPGTKAADASKRPALEIEDDIELEEGENREEEDEEDEDEDFEDESMSVGNDSFAFVKARKGEVLKTKGAAGDLRKFVALRQMQQSKSRLVVEQQHRLKNPAQILDDIFSSSEDDKDAGSESFEEEEEEDEEEEEESDFSGEDANGEILAQFSEEAESGGSSDGDGLYDLEPAQQQFLEEQVASPMRPLLGTPKDARRISVMRASLFQTGATGSAAKNAKSPFEGRLTNAFSASNISPSKRGVDLLMEVDAKEDLSIQGKLNVIDVTAEFQSNKVAKTHRGTNVKASPTKAPFRSAEPAARSEEHVVPVSIEKASVAHKKAIPVKIEGQEKSESVPMPDLSESITASRTNHCIDAGLFMGRSFRVGWGAGGKLAMSGRSSDCDSHSQVRIVRIHAFDWEGEKDKRKRELLAEAERKRHLETLELIFEHTTLPATQADGLKQANIEPNRIVVGDLFEGSQSMFQNNPTVPVPICPLGVIDRNFRFTELLKVVEKDLTTFSHEEASVWRLASALFDEIDSSAYFGTGTKCSSANLALRKELVSQWLQKSISSIKKPSSAKKSSPNSVAKEVYELLTARKIAAAVTCAIRGRDFRLATCVGQIAGPGAHVAVVGKDVGNSVKVGSVLSGNAGPVGPGSPSSGHGIFARSSTSDLVLDYLEWQIQAWMKDPASMASISPDYMNVWKLMAGNVGYWDASLVAVASQDSWRQAFGLFFWYAKGGGLGLEGALEEYDNAWRPGARLDAKPPLPKYLAAAKRSNQKDGIKDVCYNLMKLATNSETVLETVLIPATMGSNVLDHRISWLLWLVLSRAKRLREFSQHGGLVRVFDGTAKMTDASDDAADESEENLLTSILVSQTADACTLSFCSSLQAIGLWQWAAFVALFLSTQTGREAVVRDILARFYPMDAKDEESEEWLFLVGKLRIPPVWIHEAKALAARSSGNVVQESINLISAHKYVQAHQLIVAQIAGYELINAPTNITKRLLTLLEPKANVIDDWKNGGGFLLKFIECHESGKALSQKSSILSKGQDREVNAWIEECHTVLLRVSEFKENTAWMTSDTLGNRFCEAASVAVKSQWRVCIAEIAGTLVELCLRMERSYMGTKKYLFYKIPNEVLKKLPLTEDVRAKYVLG
ncbi:hypothetical protein HDU80_005274 [Chytriomyces hyalinus]|nr:hypothetical protein HDU80_005274 [Chytriomyces hyalinus]